MAIYFFFGVKARVAMQVAGRALGELVRKLGERVLPLIIPILSQGLEDPNTSRRQVRHCSVILFFVDHECAWGPL